MLSTTTFQRLEEALSIAVAAERISNNDFNLSRIIDEWVAEAGNSSTAVNIGEIGVELVFEGPTPEEAIEGLINLCMTAPTLCVRKEEERRASLMNEWKTNARFTQ